MVIVFIITKDVIKYVVLIVLSLIGFAGIVFVIKRENSKLSLAEGKKQRKVSIILNHKNNEKQYSYHTNVVLDDENKDEIVELLRNAYIHPWEKNFHAPVFKRANKRNSVRCLFEIEEEEVKKCKSEGDKKERHPSFTYEDDKNESLSESHANERMSSKFDTKIQ